MSREQLTSFELENGNVSEKEASHEESIGVNDYVVNIFLWVVFTTVLQMINIFGIVTNIINIICFVKQGFKESINISLLGLSISDLGSLATMIWSCISFTPAFMAADLPFETVEVTYLTSGMPHFAFIRVSSCITAYITLERCVCIIAPLKIKSIITTKRAAIITMSLFFIFFFSATPVFVVNRLGMKFSPLRNKSLVGIIFSENREQVQTISFAINNFAIPFGAFLNIVICTAILSVKLGEATQWRKKTTTGTQVDRVSTRNQKVAKMVVMICTLFIICFVPINVMMLAVAFIPSLALHGKNLNITLMMGGMGYTLECINSSMNIFIYYHMSSKFKITFLMLFRRTKVNAQVNACIEYKDI